MKFLNLALFEKYEERGPERCWYTDKVVIIAEGTTVVQYFKLTLDAIIHKILGKICKLVTVLLILHIAWRILNQQVFESAILA